MAPALPPPDLADPVPGQPSPPPANLDPALDSSIPGPSKDDASGEEDDEGFRRGLAALTTEGKLWTEKQRRRVREYVKPYEKQLDVSLHLLKAAESRICNCGS